MLSSDRIPCLAKPQKNRIRRIRFRIQPKPDRQRVFILCPAPVCSKRQIGQQTFLFRYAWQGTKVCIHRFDIRPYTRVVGRAHFACIRPDRSLCVYRLRLPIWRANCRALTVRRRPKRRLYGGKQFAFADRPLCKVVLKIDRGADDPVPR